MKKIVTLFAGIAALGLSCLAATPSGSTIMSKEQLDESKKIGIYTFGDSITNYLFHLNLIDNDLNGGIVANVAEYDRGFFRAGRAVPSTVRLGTKNYLIKDAALYFDASGRENIEEALTDLFGIPEEKNGTKFWYTSNFCIAGRVERMFLYLVVVNYINL